jgi:hypothetical protein
MMERRFIMGAAISRRWLRIMLLASTRRFRAEEEWDIRGEVKAGDFLKYQIIALTMLTQV